MLNIAQAALAIDGGTPVRTAPWPSRYLGTSVMGDEELALLTEVVKTKLPFRDYGDGIPHMVNDFETAACRYFKSPYALATATGSGAYYCAMAGLGIGPGDEVIIPGFSWYTNFNAPAMLGATPVFADIDTTMCMDLDDAENKITPRTKAIIMVYFQGGIPDIDRLVTLCKKHKLALVEDVAQACGGEYHGRKLGSIGDAACFSFQQNKIMSTGDGGMMLTPDPIIYERAIRFHDLGIVRNVFKQRLANDLKSADFVGCQFRMNEFTGAVALAQLQKLDRMILTITRKAHASLRARIKNNCQGLSLRPVADENGDPGIALYMDLRTAERADWFSKALSAEGIVTGPSSSCTNLLHLPLTINRQQTHPAMPPFGKGWPGEQVRYSADLCPQTDKILARMVCIALGPKYDDAVVNDIGTAIEKVWKAMKQ